MSNPTTPPVPRASSDAVSGLSRLRQFAAGEQAGAAWLGCLGARFGHHRVPRGAIGALLGEPAVGGLERLRIQCPQRGDVFRAALFQVFPLVEALLVLARQEKRLAFTQLRGGEDRLERVVVPRRDRIEFVVVAARATHGQTHNPVAHAEHHFG